MTYLRLRALFSGLLLPPQAEKRVPCPATEFPVEYPRRGRGRLVRCAGHTLIFAAAARATGPGGHLAAGPPAGATPRHLGILRCARSFYVAFEGHASRACFTPTVTPPPRPPILFSI